MSRGIGSGVSGRGSWGHFGGRLCLALAGLVAGLGAWPEALASAGRRPLQGAVESLVIRESEPLRLPFGTLSWSGLVVRAGEPAVAGTSEEPRVEAEGTWTIGLELPEGKEVNRHGLVIELAPGLRARPDRSYDGVRVEGSRLKHPVSIEVLVTSVAGQEQPALALAMGDRIYFELFEVRSGDRLRLRSMAAVVEEAQASGGVCPLAGSTVLPCGGYGVACAGFSQVAAGGYHSLALTTGGEVRAWGANDLGQLGDGTTTESSLPVVVEAVGGGGPLTGIVQVAAGWYHSLALTTGGEVRAWGRNFRGELGDGTTTDRALPVVVQAVGGGGPLTGIVQVAGWGDHSLALTSGGEVRAWGDNFRGELGDGTTTDRSLAVVVQAVGGGGPLTGIVQVAGGGDHSLALTTGGEVRAWGDNVTGQLGDGTTTDSSLPVVVQTVGGGGPLTGVVQVAAGGLHSLALTTGGEVRAWGFNRDGQLGDGTTTSRTLPVVVQAVGGASPLTGIVQVAAGGYHSEALTTGSEVRAWGRNVLGQLGDGTTTDSSLPVVVEEVGGSGPLTGVVQVAAGWYHSWR